MIVEDDPQREKIPAWLHEMDEIILLFQSFDLQRWVRATAGRSNDDDVNMDHLTTANLTGDPEKDYFYVINGEYRPTICLKQNEWKRLRMIHNDVLFETEILMGDTDNCQVKLLAKDGVYISPSPRNISTNLIYFTQSSRVDIIIKCTQVGVFDILTWDHVEEQQNLTWLIGYLEVTESESNDTNIVDITQFEPYRPRYLQDLSALETDDIDNLWAIKNGRNVINDVPFAGPYNFTEEYQPEVNKLVNGILVIRGKMKDIQYIFMSIIFRLLKVMNTLEQIHYLH